MDTEKSPEKKALFHGGFFYLERINELLKALDIVTMTRYTDPEQIKLWSQNYSLLNALFKEIYPKMSKEEKEEHIEAATEVKKQWDDAAACYKSGRETSTKFLAYFDVWELNLRDITERKGLNMPNKLDMSEATEL